MSVERDAYVQDMKKKIGGWNLALHKFQIKANQSTADVLAEYKKEIEKIKTMRDDLEGKFTNLQKAEETAWDDLKIGVDHAWQTLGNSIHTAQSRFRS